MSETMSDKNRLRLLYLDLIVESARLITRIIEILELQEIKDFSDAKKQDLNNFASFKNKSFSQYSEELKCEIIDLNDGISLLENYYFLEKKFLQAYKTKMGNIAAENGTRFNKDSFNTLVEQISGNMKDVRVTRNGTIHNVDITPEAFELAVCIRAMENIVKAGQKLIDIILRVDSYPILIEKKQQLADFQSQLPGFKAQCFAERTERKDSSVIFKFKEDEYVIDSDQEDDFDILLLDMLESWDDGMRSLKYDYDEFAKAVSKHFPNRMSFIDFREDFESFNSSEISDTERNIRYLRMINRLASHNKGIYWKGQRFSESYFASYVLQSIVKHFDKNSFEEKRSTLEYRINHFEEWRNSEGKQKGIGLNLISFCEKRILSSYYSKNEDSQGIELATTFENRILAVNNNSMTEEQYDKVINATLALIAYMRKKVTYAIPVIENDAANIVESMEDLKDFMKAYLSQHSVDEVAALVHVIKDDNSYKFFKENVNLYINED